MFGASPGWGYHCRGQQSPNLAEPAKKLSFTPAQPLRAGGSQPHRGFISSPGSKKSALASKLCSMASQSSFQSTKQREERIFFASFYLHSLLKAVCLLVPISIFHCTTVICKNCCTSTADHTLLPGRRHSLSTVCRK